MAKRTTRQQVEEALRHVELERDHQRQILDAMLRGIAPDGVEAAPIYSPSSAGEREAECRMNLFGATRANGGLVLCVYAYTDGSAMNWWIQRLDDSPFPARIEYHACRDAWDRLLQKRRELMAR